eukprot:6162246-Pleurochrysis_carterae.AAC.1
MQGEHSQSEKEVRVPWRARLAEENSAGFSPPSLDLCCSWPLEARTPLLAGRAARPESERGGGVENARGGGAAGARERHWQCLR